MNRHAFILTLVFLGLVGFFGILFLVVLQDREHERWAAYRWCLPYHPVQDCRELHP